ncbi:MAG: glycerol-3-phosphate 1-O-acyltransferase PlsY [Defluviitaleaceae bacterium]|nr:glycerol-3-phosphate 1-O-acyltransferase PlsY [Defluviitaleaceae bacterium]
MTEWLYNLPWWGYGLFLLAGYPFGALQSAYFVGKILGKIDIRDHGSGNAGTTNVYRVMGFKAGIIVLIFDILKTVIPVIILNAILYQGRIWDISAMEYFPGLLLGFGVVLGHNFPFFLKFKGGKGVACAIGLMIMFDPIVLAIILTMALAIVLTTRLISLASIIGFVAFGAVNSFFYWEYMPIVVFAWTFAALGLIQHRKNIKWLITGEEKKFDFKTKGRL